LRFDLLSPEHRAAAGRHLAENIEKNGGRLTTGFLGVGHILPALSGAGRDDLAYRLLLSEEFPSWGYSIKQGATTTWERWDGWTADKGFQNPRMNSFNHYAFGAAAEWIYSVLAGIDIDPDAPGYKRIIVRPRPGGKIKHVVAALDTVRGRVESEWRVMDGRFALRVLISLTTCCDIWVQPVLGP
jgi:alpha-L-rhamnosidase